MFMFDGFTYRDLSCQISRSPPKGSTLFDRKCVLCTLTLCDFALNWMPSKQTRQMSSSLALFLYPQASCRRTEHLGGWTTQDSARRAGANYVLCFVIGRKQQCAPRDKRASDRASLFSSAWDCGWSCPAGMSTPVSIYRHTKSVSFTSRQILILCRELCILHVCREDITHVHKCSIYSIYEINQSTSVCFHLFLLLSILSTVTRLISPCSNPTYLLHQYHWNHLLRLFFEVQDLLLERYFGLEAHS